MVVVVPKSRFVTNHHQSVILNLIQDDGLMVI
jgi:hypothetical protein